MCTTDPIYLLHRQARRLAVLNVVKGLIRAFIARWHLGTLGWLCVYNRQTGSFNRQLKSRPAHTKLLCCANAWLWLVLSYEHI